MGCTGFPLIQQNFNAFLTILHPSFSLIEKPIIVKCIKHITVIKIFKARLVFFCRSEFQQFLSYLAAIVAKPGRSHLSGGKFIESRARWNTCLWPWWQSKFLFFFFIRTPLPIQRVGIVSWLLAELDRNRRVISLMSEKYKR